MGSEILTAIILQRGQKSTVPTQTRPVEQRTATPTTMAPSQPIQQRLGTSTLDGFSKPVQQRFPDTFNEVASTPDDCFIEQKSSERSSEGPDSPLEQLIFVTSNLRATTIGNSQMEQRNLSRNSDGDEPIEQVPKKSNTVDVTQFDFAELLFPQCNSIKNPVNTNILWRIKDFGFSFDVETLIFIIDGTQVQDNSSFSVTAITNGLQLDYNPSTDFDFGTTVTIDLFISDNAVPPNNFSYTCRWDTVEDTQPPIIALTSPECDTTDVGVFDSVVFSVSDVGEGVDLSSIKLSIEGIPVCEGLSFDGFTTNSGSGFTGTWDHLDDPFRFDSNVSIAIEAADLADPPNSALFVCCFETGSSQTPDFFNWDPAQCKTFVDNTTDLSFEVYGDVDGIDISTLEVRIDNALRKVFVRPRIRRSE